MTATIAAMSLRLLRISSLVGRAWPVVRSALFALACLAELLLPRPRLVLGLVLDFAAAVAPFLLAVGGDERAGESCDESGADVGAACTACDCA